MSADQYISEIVHGFENSALSRLHLEDMQLATERIEKANKNIAALLAEKIALRAALAKFDPSHPMLVDDVLIRKMQNAGERKFAEPANHSWSEIGHASDSVRYDYTPPDQVGGAGVVALKRQLSATEVANVKNCVEKNALHVALKRIDKNHPLVRPEPDQNVLVAALRKAGLMAYSFGGYEAAAEAGRNFKYPEDMLSGQRESVLEAYPGEIEALESRLALLRDAQGSHRF